MVMWEDKRKEALKEYVKLLEICKKYHGSYTTEDLVILEKYGESKRGWHWPFDVTTNWIKIFFELTDEEVENASTKKIQE